MTLNKQKGNMYPWVSATWNPIGGKCPHECSYCYMRYLWPRLGEIQLREHYLKDDLSKETAIFVGSACDMWAESVPDWWITAVLHCCRPHRDVTFLFQTKNPLRFQMFELYPPKTILGTTIESNRHYFSKAPDVVERARAMHSMRRWKQQRMVSIEPVLDFDLDEFVAWIDAIAPDFVSIGADSKGHGLPEPSGDKLNRFIAELREFTDVRIKNNLARLGVDVGV